MRLAVFRKTHAHAGAHSKYYDFPHVAPTMTKTRETRARSVNVTTKTECFDFHQVLVRVPLGEGATCMSAGLRT